MPWLILIFAIVGEVIATAALKASDGLTRPGYAVLSLLTYAIAIYLLGLVLRTIPIGVAYAIWSGLGILLVTIIGTVLFGQRLDPPALLGIGLIVAGVLVLNLWGAAPPS